MKENETYSKFPVESLVSKDQGDLPAVNAKIESLLHFYTTNLMFSRVGDVKALSIRYATNETISNNKNARDNQLWLNKGLVAGISMLQVTHSFWMSFVH